MKEVERKLYEKTDNGMVRAFRMAGIGMKKNNVLCIQRKKLSTPLLCMKCISMAVQRFQFEITITHITFQPSVVANGRPKLLLTS